MNRFDQPHFHEFTTDYRKAFALGNSLPWTEVLFVLTGEREVRADAFLEYFAPLDEWLQQLISDYDIPVGW